MEFSDQPKSEDPEAEAEGKKVRLLSNDFEELLSGIRCHGAGRGYASAVWRNGEVVRGLWIGGNMETLLLCLMLLLGCCGLAMELLMVMLLWKVMSRERQTSEEPCTAAELPEEVESRRLAAEAQRAILAFTPGSSTERLEDMHMKNIRRPMFPLDDNFM